jgi:hypothetical protein
VGIVCDARTQLCERVGDVLRVAVHGILAQARLVVKLLPLVDRIIQVVREPKRTAVRTGHIAGPLAKDDDQILAEHVGAAQLDEHPRPFEHAPRE